jgi:hypothetical protein
MPPQHQVTPHDQPVAQQFPGHPQAAHPQPAQRPEALRQDVQRPAAPPQPPAQRQQSDWWTAPDPWAPADSQAADAAPGAGRGRYEPPAAQGLPADPGGR